MNTMKVEVEMLTRNAETAARLLKSLAHAQRLQILCHLSTGEKTVGELEELCGASQSAVSQFLGRMKAEGLLASERRGKFVVYRVTDGNVLKLMRALHKIFCN